MDMPTMFVDSGGGLLGSALYIFNYIFAKKGDNVSTPGWGLSVWSLDVLPVYAWVLSGYSGFLPPSKNMHVRLTGVSKTVPRSECERVCVVVCLVCLCVAL